MNLCNNGANITYKKKDNQTLLHLVIKIYKALKYILVKKKFFSSLSI